MILGVLAIGCSPTRPVQSAGPEVTAGTPGEIEEAPGPPEVTTAPEIEHFWKAMTVYGEAERDSGLYTLVLFSRRMDNPSGLDEQTAERYQAVLHAIGGIEGLDTETDSAGAAATHIFYIPGRERVTDSAALAANYNPELAFAYLRKVRTLLVDHRRIRRRLTSHPGPFFISFSQITLENPVRERPVMYADLTRTNPAAMREVVKAYKLKVVSAAPETVERFNPLRLRFLSVVLNIDDNLRLVRSALGSWIPGVPSDDEENAPDETN